MSNATQDIQTCLLCKETRSEKSRSRVCPNCMSWWRYHFTVQHHGPTYFADYQIMHERALLRSAFASGRNASKLVKARFNGNGKR